MKLTREQRNALPDLAFAISSRRAYPVPTKTQLKSVGQPVSSGPSHARNALSRVSHFGTATEKTKVCQTVSQRYPNVHAKSCPAHERMEKM